MRDIERDSEGRINRDRKRDRGSYRDRDSERRMNRDSDRDHNMVKACETSKGTAKGV